MYQYNVLCACNEGIVCIYQYKVLCAFVIRLFKVRGLGEAPGIQKAYSMFVIEKNDATKG